MAGPVKGGQGPGWSNAAWLLVANFPNQRNQRASVFVYTLEVEMGPKESESYESESPGWEFWYRQYWAGLVKSAWLMCGSREVAEDVVHDAFVRLYRSGVAPDKPLAYLRRTVVNLLVDSSRRSRLAHAASAEESIMGLEVDEMETWRYVNKLPLRQRQALVLRYLDDMTVEGIAEVMYCSVAAVKSLIHRGLESLREEMGASGQY